MKPPKGWFYSIAGIHDPAGYRRVLNCRMLFVTKVRSRWRVAMGGKEHHIAFARLADAITAAEMLAEGKERS
jgi:hypothetical protein